MERKRKGRDVVACQERGYEEKGKTHWETATQSPVGGMRTGGAGATDGEGKGRKLGW